MIDDHHEKQVRSFEYLLVWQEGVTLSVDLYRALKDCLDYGLKDQMQKSAVSIPSNIAEGYERDSNNDYIRFLNIAKASCGELRTQLIIAKALNIFPEKTVNDFLERTRKMSSMLYKYIQARKTRFS